MALFVHLTDVTFYLKLCNKALPITAASLYFNTTCPYSTKVNPNTNIAKLRYFIFDSSDGRYIFACMPHQIVIVIPNSCNIALYFSAWVASWSRDPKGRREQITLQNTGWNKPAKRVRSGMRMRRHVREPATLSATRREAPQRWTKKELQLRTG